MVAQNSSPRTSGSAQTATDMGQGAAQIQEKMGQAVDQAQAMAGQLVDQAKQQTTSRLATQKVKAADTLYATAHALRQTGQQLREQDQAPIAALTDQAADQFERSSSYLRNRDLPQILEETQQLGRTHPMLFTGGALVLGLFAVRFLKSSQRQQQLQSEPPQLPAPSMGSTTPTWDVGRTRSTTVIRDDGVDGQSYETGILEDEDVVLPPRDTLAGS